MWAKRKASKKLESLFRVLAAWAHLRRSVGQNGPAALLATYYRLSEHSSNKRAAAPTTTGAGTDTSAFAYLLECLSPGLNSFNDGAFADLVAQTCGFKILDDRLLSSFLF